MKLKTSDKIVGFISEQFKFSNSNSISNSLGNSPLSMYTLVVSVG